MQPVTGLSVGIYTASVQVSGSSINTAGFDVSFTVTTDPDDAAAVTAAKNAIEGRTYTAAQADAGDADALKAALAEQINSLPGVSSTGIIVKASDITISGFIAAVAGDADAPAGTNGSFNFTVALSKGSATGTAGKDGGTITAAAYTDPNDTNRDGYHDGDVAVINAMIRNNGLSATENAPASWGFVRWNSAAPRRIVGLEMNAKRLTGTLDLTGLTELTDVDCSENLLTDINGLPALTKLEQLDCADTDIRRLDVSGNPALIHLDCQSCPLTCLNVGENTGLDLQKSDTAMDLQVTEDTFKITDKIAGIDPSKVEVLSGADYDKTTGTVSNYRSGIPIVYTYDAGTTKDGKSQLKVTLAVTVSRLQNAWTTEPSIEDWTYGESAKTAVGSAKYGTVAFTWSDSENGPFKAEAPATAGTWYMKAGVPAGDEYTGLNKVVRFTIHKAENTSTAPISIKGWTFGDAPQTASAGFKFGTPRYVYSNQPNGTFTETVPTAAGTWYVKAIVDETTDYAGAESEAAAFVIAPKKAGADSSISVPDINSSTNLDKLVIKDDDKVLVKGTDYDVTKKQDGNKVTVTVTFKGNYTGSVTKTYTVTAQNPSDKTESGSVKTGDNSMIGLFAVLSILSLGVIIVLIIIKRRNNALKKQR